METSGLVAFVGTALAIACLRPLSAKLQLVDLPNQRKQHVGAIPLIGGIAVCLGVYLSVFFTRHSAPDLGINLPIALTQYLQNDLLV
ncbi:hypothetical protein ACV1C2_20315, partial [Aeromonas hydrophila]